MPGSSPLARGLRWPLSWALSGGRIIPARAGFTWGDASAALHFAGSSPLARGLLPLLPGEVDDSRIIPARAGFTRLSHAMLSPRSDHPRSRGVYHYRSVNFPLFSGSSPLARGLQHWYERGDRTYRIIPARAGFTQSAGRNHHPERDHPRSRGVYVGPLQVTYPGYGSSPLARGLRRRAEWRPRASGIIPARAGFTRHPSNRPGARRDHPRSRGVYCVRARSVS